MMRRHADWKANSDDFRLPIEYFRYILIAMPPAKKPTSRTNARTTPYPASKPEGPANDKENEAPRDSASPVDLTPRKAPEKKRGRKSGAKDSKTKAMPTCRTVTSTLTSKRRRAKCLAMKMYVVVIQPFDKY